MTLHRDIQWTVSRPTCRVTTVWPALAAHSVTRLVLPTPTSPSSSTGWPTLTAAPTLSRLRRVLATSTILAPAAPSLESEASLGRDTWPIEATLVGAH